MNSQQFTFWYQNHNFDKYCKPLIMGVLNITPDSFSDGGNFLNPEKALRHATKMIKEGADIIDIGGESSKPGINPTPLDVELDRVIPVIQKIHKQSDICISIDTYKAKVMQEAVAVGANIINDIKALQSPDSLATAANLNVPVCLMHMKGDPKTMQNCAFYTNNIIDEINFFFEQRIKECINAGIAKHNLLIDPGFGFGKTIDHNLIMVKNLSKFKKHDLPILLGVSRKSTIGKILQAKVLSRLTGSLAFAVFAIMNGASIIRTHDVKETKQAFKIIDAIMSSEHKKEFGLGEEML